MGDTGESTISRSIRTLFKSGFVLIVGVFVEMGISFVAKIVMARYLNPGGYGRVSLGITMLGILSSLTLLGMKSGVGRYLSRDSAASYRRGVLVSAYQIVVPLSTLIGLTLFLSAGPVASRVFHDPSITSTLRIFALAIPVAAFVKLSLGSVQGMQDSLPKVYIQNGALPLGRLIGVAVATYLGLAAVGIAGAYLGSYLFAGVLCLYYLYNHTPIFEDVYPQRVHWELLEYSLPLMVSGFAGLIFADLDIVLLGMFATSEAVGIYNVVYPISQLVVLLLSSFSFLTLPVISELQATDKENEIPRIYQVLTKWVVIGSLPFFLVIFGFPSAVIWTLFGGEYLPGELALSVLVVGFFVNVVTGPNQQVMSALGRTKYLMWLNIGAAVVNVSLNLALIPEYSYLGAAIATAISYAGMNILMTWKLYDIWRIQPFSIGLLVPGIAGAALAAGFWLFAEVFLVASIPVLILLLVVFILAYFVVILQFGGVEEEELMLIKNVEERFGVDLSVLKKFAT